MSHGKLETLANWLSVVHSLLFTWFDLLMGLQGLNRIIFDHSTSARHSFSVNRSLSLSLALLICVLLSLSLSRSLSLSLSRSFSLSLSLSRGLSLFLSRSHSVSWSLFAHARIHVSAWQWRSLLDMSCVFLIMPVVV